MTENQEMTKNQKIAAAVQGEVMKRETTTSLQLQDIICAKLDEAYPDGAKEEKKKPAKKKDDG